ncbi:SH3 domain-containing protein [Tamlana sp. I1]|uniref:SH3 domain-containing protein n=1 Tax=Tamlana sp. I1 TaxID=2762061 RepID=UPI00188ED927|nr:SH3 domain-containing protein [Tamlana sp. I1]
MKYFIYPFVCFFICFCKPDVKNTVDNINNKQKKKDLNLNNEDLKEKYLVTASNGLFVRINSSINAEKANLLPYGTEVTVINQTYDSLTITENGFKIKGHWVRIENDSINNESYVFNGFLKTIRQIEEACERPMYVYKEKKWKDFYGVYQFSNNVIGIALLESDEEGNDAKLDFNKTNENYFNELIDSVNSHSLYKDTFVRLFKNKLVTSKYNSMVGEDFYIYCYNKIVKAKVEDVFFHTDECSVSFIMLKLDEKLFNETTGIPLFASKRRLENIEFNSFKKETTHFNYKTDICHLWADCLFENDNEHITFFLKHENYFFGYRNDSNYSDHNSIEPYRYIVSFDDNKIYYHLSSHLDLFGCPCL